ncbi:MAG: CapA family protein [Phenylobacterium sp.]|uniref:CapA family protein n=1 Tax=Phenylobacterium sp. TaxID=1871053 RepID=UPI00391CEAA6
MNRRQLLALAGASFATAAGAQATDLRVTLLGQALLEHAFGPAEWPGRTAVRERLAQAHAVFTNLETVIEGPRAGAPTRELLTLHAAGPEILDVLRDLRINLVATANNHAFDLGSGGILDTAEALRAANLPSAGSGADLAAASAPAFVAIPAGTVALVAFATGKVREGGAATPDRPGVNEVRRSDDGEILAEDRERVLAALRSAKARADVVIAYHHNHDWEPDNTQVPEWQRRFAKACAAAGASVFVGHGAPVLQGVEVFEGVPLFYGLGNFFFQTEKAPGAYPRESWEGAIVECGFRNGRCRSARLIPLELNEIGLGGADDMATRGAPSLASPETSRRILERLAGRSAPFGTVIRTAGPECELVLPASSD